MAKRKNLKNVNINSGELNPVTIGYLNTRKKGPFLTIFIFAILLAVLYYMPQISNYVNKYINPSAYVDNKDSNDNTITNENGVLKELTASTTIIVNKITFSNFSLNNSTIQFSINGDSSLNNYYLRTYDENKNLLETLPITGSSIRVAKSNISYIAIDIITDYQEEETVENNSISCTNNETSYEYLFNEDKLISVTFKYEMIKSELNESLYNENYTKYTNEASQASLVGITREISNTSNGFVFTKTFDLATASMVNIDDENVFSLNAEKQTVLNTMNNKGFDCN